MFITILFLSLLLAFYNISFSLIFLLASMIYLLYIKKTYNGMYEGGLKIGRGGICSCDSDCESNKCVEGRCVKYRGCI